MTASVKIPLAAASYLELVQSWPTNVVVAGLLVFAFLLLFWIILGPGPARRRQFKRATRLLRLGQWRDALLIIQKLRRGKHSKAWQDRLRQTEGECQRLAGIHAVQAKDFEKALEHHCQAAELLELNAGEVRAGVFEKMLAEVRALFAASSDTRPVHALIDRVRALHDPFICPEASFWQGLCSIREGKWLEAREALEAAREVMDSGQWTVVSERQGVRGQGSGVREIVDSGQWTVDSEKVTDRQSPSTVHRPLSTNHQPPSTLHVDPPLYLGGILLRMGQAKEGLRYISEANREASACPWIALHLGIAMVAAGADGHLAARALNRALCPRGLPSWLSEPDKAWIDGLPEDRSYVRKLAAKHHFVCPLWGNDLRLLIRQGQMALGQAFYSKEDYLPAADAFQKLFDEGAPTHDVLRWLGLTLAQLERYQEAFKHLKTAYDLEEPKDRLTTGYLALCAASGKPDRPEDKGPNVAWAIGAIRQFDVADTTDQEWIGLLKRIFGEALKLDMALAGVDLLFLCDQLASVQAVDAEAALAYHQLATEHPELLKPVHAWLYCRAASKHNLDQPHALELFARTVQDQDSARAYFAQQGWDHEEVEFIHLKLASIKLPGTFPESLGSNYALRGEAFLLDRSQKMEAQGNVIAALESMDVLLRLSPQCWKAHDRLAMLCFRRGDLDRAAELLENWRQFDDANPVPWTRLAIVEHLRGKRDEAIRAIKEAIARAAEEEKANLGCLAARLALTTPVNSNGTAEYSQQALELLQSTLQRQPHHEQALWLMAAVCASMGDRAGLAALSTRMSGVASDDGRFQYFAALSHLAAGQYAEAVTAATKASLDATLKTEADYLLGLAKMHLGNTQEAIATLRQVIENGETASVHHARAILGRLQFQIGAFDDAVTSWQSLPSANQSTFGLTTTLQQTLLLAGLQALREEKFEHAVERFRAAGRAGLRDRQLGELIRHALLKAGQQCLTSRASAAPENSGLGLDAAVRSLEQANQAGASDPNILYLLAMARKHHGRFSDARAALHKIATPDANVLLQMGLLSFMDSRLADAEQEFTRALERDASCQAARYNLMLTRLCQGETGAALALIEQLQATTTSDDDKHWFGMLAKLFEASTEPASTMRDKKQALTDISADDEARLLGFLDELGRQEEVFPLFQALASARPDSSSAQQAYAVAVLRHAKLLSDRCHWDAAARLLRPLAATPSRLDPSLQQATYNLLGCCQCMLQEYDHGIECFSWATKLSPNDPWLHQNLALAWELKGQLDEADGHWNRFFDLQNRAPVPPTANYRDSLTFEGLTRLADAYGKAERWNLAVSYLQRASRVRPGDFDALERLFHMYNQVKRPADARRTLQRMRELRPADPQLELYDLDLLEVSSLADIERMVAEIRKTLGKHPSDIRVQEKATMLVGTLIPYVRRMGEQYIDQFNRVAGQMNRLPQYQINWSAVRDVMGNLQQEFKHMRRVATACRSLTTNDDHRRVLRELIEVIDKKVDDCQLTEA